MDREYYNSLQEAYELGERGPTGGYKDAKVKIQNIFKKGAGGGQGNKGRNSRPTPAAAPAKQTPAASPASTPRAAAPAPKPQPKAQPKPSAPARKPGVSGTSSDGKPITTASVRARNQAAADKAASEQPKTKVTGISPRMDKALSGIGKWNEETLLAYAEQLVEENYCDTIESALVVLQHLSPQALDEALG